jgi:cytochrome c-type biogenesis protein
VGLGIPFILSAILIDSLKGAFDFIKRHYRTVEIVSGVLLITLGIMMVTGYLGRLLSLMSF